MRYLDLGIFIDTRNNVMARPSIDMTSQLTGITPIEERIYTFPAEPPDWYMRLAEKYGTVAQVKAAKDK
jgi:hypothetical protein